MHHLYFSQSKASFLLKVFVFDVYPVMFHLTKLQHIVDEGLFSMMNNIRA